MAYNQFKCLYQQDELMNKVIFNDHDRKKSWLQRLDFYHHGYQAYKNGAVKCVEVQVESHRRIKVCSVVWINRVYYRAEIRLVWSEFQNDFDIVHHTSDFHSYYDDVVVTATLYYVLEHRLEAKDILIKEDSSIDYFALHSIQEYKLSMDSLLKDVKSAAPVLALPLTGPFVCDMELNKDGNIVVKVGEAGSRLYAIKNINNLLECISTGKSIKLGKNEAFMQFSDFKDERSLRILKVLNQIVYDLSVADIKTIPIHRELDVLIQEVADVMDEIGLDYEVFDSLPIDIIDYKLYYEMTLGIEYDDYFLKENNLITTNNGSYHLYKLNKATVKLFDRLHASSQFPLVTKKKDLETIISLTKDKAIFNDNGHPYVNEILPLQMVFDMDDNYNVTFALQFVHTDGTVSNAYDPNTTYGDLKAINDFVIPYTMDYDSDSQYFLMDVNKQKVRRFLQQGLEPLKQFGKVLASEDVMRVVTAKHISRVNTGVRFNNGLLTVDFASDSIQPKEWVDILKQYKRKKKYYQLKNGEMLELDNSPAFDDVLQLMERLDVSVDDIDENGTIEANKYRLLGMEDTFDKMDLLDINRDDSYREALENFVQYDPDNYSIPDKYNCLFRDYQKDGFKWLSYMLDAGFNPILADDMGLGKTLQVLALLEYRKSEGSNIIIAPATLVYNWKEEIEKFNVAIDAVCVVGETSQRKQAYTQNHELYITSYDYMRRDHDLLSDKTFNIVVLDEAQYIKNSTTKNAESVKTLQSKHRIALTGTPIENTLAELWSIFDFLMPGYLYSYKTFKRLFERPIVQLEDDQASIELKHLVAPFILRRVKTDVLKELPEKIEIIHSVEFTLEEKKVYDAQLKSVSYQIQQLDMKQATSKVKVLAMLLRLRQMCCDLRLVFDDITHPSSKVDSAFEIIETVKAEGNKVLLFSSFSSMLDLLAIRATELGIKYHKLTGKDSKEKRKETIAQFNTDDSTLFLISLKAGGTGLNLTAANTVIHFDPWWNQSATNQASDRAYRLGQEKNVTVYKLVMHDSLEEKIIKMQEQKNALAQEFIQNNSGALSQLSKDEILNLF